MARRPKCFIVIARHGANAFFPVDRASTRQGAERSKRAFQKKHPYKRFAVKNMCASFGDGAPAAPAAPPAAAPAAKPIAGWWPFGKKKPKRVNPMSKTVMYEPTKGGGYVSRLGRAKQKRRR